MEHRKLSAGFGAEADRIPEDFREVWETFFASQVVFVVMSSLTRTT